MKYVKRIALSAALITLSGCASNEAQIRKVIENNPDLIFSVIEKNPERFIDVVNRAAREAQKMQYEKQAGEIQKQQNEDLLNPKHPKLSDAERILGESSSPITVVEYGDFQCPACRMAYDGLKKFEAEHRGQIQFYFKNMPLDFHKLAYPAALYFTAVEAQDPKKAALYYDILYENQNHLGEKDFLEKTARTVGVNMKALEAARNSEKVKKQIEDDMAEFENFKFTGTPVVILNGVALNGAQNVSELDRVLELTKKRTN